MTVGTGTDQGTGGEGGGGPACGAGAPSVAAGLLDRGEAFLRIRGTLFLVALLAGVVVALVGIRAGDAGPGDLDVLVTLLLLEAGAIAALVLAGAVSGEMRRGVTLLWIQKPRSIRMYYLTRAGEGLLLALALALVFLGVQALTLAMVGGDWMRFVAAAAASLPSVVLLVGAAVFLLSCMGVQGDGLAALLLLLVWIGAGELLGSQVGFAGSAGRLLLGSAPPLGFVVGLREWGLGEGGPSAAEGVRYLIWVSSITGSALLILGGRLRQPFPTEQSR
jgi:hypothetical protein